MANRLDPEEIKKALAKLRSQYNTLGEQYDRAIFDISKFQDRYMNALRQGYPLERFLANEIEILKDLKGRAEEKYAPKERPATDKADKLLEEFRERIAKYPPLPFSEKADDETWRLAGALKALSVKWGHLVPSSGALPPGSRAEKLAASLEERVYTMLVPGRGGKEARIIEDLALELERITSGTGERDRAKSGFFKECGFLFNRLKDLFTEMIEDTSVECREDELEQAIRNLDNAMNDFRIREFRLRDENL